MSENSLPPKEIEKQLLHEFKQLERHGDKVPAYFYEHLFRADPMLRSNFNGVSMDRQGAMLFQAIGALINHLSRIEDFASSLHALGTRHEEYGVLPHNYDLAKIVMVETVREFLGDAFNEQSELNWYFALSSATELMIEGADKYRASDRIETDREPSSSSQEDYLARFAKTDLHYSCDTPIASGTALESSIPVLFLTEKETSGVPLQTILQISKANEIPHFNECGGRAKCTTCRVAIIEGQENVLPRNREEYVLAKKKDFPDSVRLACQTRVTGPVTVKRLVFDDEDATEIYEEEMKYPGQEKEVAVMFADIRSFTEFSCSNLPYDVIHALNRYYRIICEVIDRHDGYLDKFMGDGLMAVFGLTRESRAPCVDAVAAAIEMQKAMGRVNSYHEEHFGDPLRIGIGIHFGSVIVGDLGFKGKRQFTAVGETVNIASRIESMTKILATDTLVSDAVRCEINRSDFNFGPPTPVTLQGINRAVVLHSLKAGESILPTCGLSETS